jgi:DNA topoisomerase-1
MAKKTVIVESPTKAKTISRYLGPDYRVVSSVGHVRDLPKSSLGVDPENGFEPQYVQITGKARVIKELKDAIKGAEMVYLAPDPDREGEAIAWHIAEIIKVPVQRVEFEEITKKAVLEALKHPREIDYHRVDAQQARRVLDRLVGYSISPLMWRKIKPGLSAGRVQSVAVRLICERETEIRNFKPQEYWSFEAKFKAGQDEFSAVLWRVEGQRIGRPAGELDGSEHRSDEEADNGNLRIISSREEAQALLAGMRAAQYKAGETALRQLTRRPPPPFTTSTMQQDASRRLGWTARRAMQIAQQLYEGIDVGNGPEGLITYMRTDSVRVSAGAQQAARERIAQAFGADYLPPAPPVYKSKALAQEAHEAVRPTMLEYEPARVQRSLSTDQYKLYKLIYERFLASQMRGAEFESQSLEVLGGAYVFRASATRVKFKGFLAVYGDEREESFTALPELKPGSAVDLGQVDGSQHFTKPPPRFGDATLVKALEEQGIGRPSTYAAIIETILARGYVVRAGRVLEPTEWGFVTTEMLTHYFPDIVDVGFTRDMESKLDAVEEGQQDWRALLKDFYGPFKSKIEAAGAEKKYFKAKPMETEFHCELCGAVMLMRHGKFGRFLSCSRYPECKGLKNLDDKGNPVDKPVTEAGQAIERLCPKCGKQLSVKVSRWGTKFIGCSGYPKCDYTSELQTQCPKCGGELLRKQLQNRRVILVCKNNEESAGAKCDFVLWGKPLIETCPECGFWLAEQKIRGTDKWRRYCPNVDCVNHKGIGEDATGEEEGEEVGAASES